MSVFNWWGEPFRTGKIEKGKARIINLPGEPVIEVPMERCEAGLGNLIHEYVRRLNIPWWRRLFYPGVDIEIESIREKLNTVIILWHR